MLQGVGNCCVMPHKHCSLWGIMQQTVGPEILRIFTRAALIVLRAGAGGGQNIIKAAVVVLILDGIWAAWGIFFP